MRALLVQTVETDRGFIHLGLAFIAACLEARGHEVRVLDLGIVAESRSNVTKIIMEMSPDVVGITTITSTYPAALRVATIIKQLFPKCPVVFGGTHPNVLTDDVIREPDVDYVVRGEGEITMVELLDAMGKGQGFAEIKGLSYKESGSIVHNAPRPFISDLDTLPAIPWHLFPIDKYTAKLNGKKAVGLSTARGCPFHCVFCYRGPAAGNTVRMWSPERVMKEINILRERYRITRIYFWNDVFTYDRRWVEALCDLICGAGIDIEWSCQTRADLLNEHMLRKMKNAGCISITLGVESGNDDVLHNIDKRLTKRQIADAFALLQEIGIETAATFTLGLPWDTSASIRETLEFAKEINPDCAMFYVATPFPGSPLWRMSEERGIQLSRNWANYRMLPFEVEVKGMAPLFDTSKLSLSDFRGFLKTAQIEFQFSRLRGGPERRAKGIRNILALLKLSVVRTGSIKRFARFLIRVALDTVMFVWRKCLRAVSSRY